MTEVANRRPLTQAYRTGTSTRTIETTTARHDRKAANAINRGPRNGFSEATALPGSEYSMYISGLYCAGRYGGCDKSR
jgi:hypothetical protein